MNPEILQLGGTVVVALAAMELVKFVINKYTKNGDRMIDREQSEVITINSQNIAVMLNRLKTIEENHLPHLMLEEEKNRDEHKEIMKKLVVIETKVGNFNNNKTK